MTAYIPTNSFGGTMSINADEIKEEIIVQTDRIYLNELGDSMKGNIGMNNFIIKDSGEPVDPKDVVNKAYVNTYVNTHTEESIKSAIDKTVRPMIIKATDTLHTLISNTSISIEEEFKKHRTQIITFKDSIQTDIHIALSDCKKKVDAEIIKLTEETKATHKELANSVAKALSNVGVINMFVLEKEKRKVYHSILDKYKPKFWLSAMFPYGFENSHTSDKWNFKDLSGNGLIIKHTPELKMDNEHHIGIYFDSTVRIKSHFAFSNSFTFVILCRKDKGSLGSSTPTGRLITGMWGNMAIGYWSTHSDVVHLNEFISFGQVNEKSELYFFIVRSDIKNKYVYFHNVFENITKGQKVESLTKFNQVVLGRPITFSKESLSGYIYECICFDYFIENLDEIKNFIKKYYS